MSDRARSSAPLTRPGRSAAPPVRRRPVALRTPRSNQRAIQAQLHVGQPNDAFEREAESVANTVMRAAAPPAKDPPKKDEDKKVAKAAAPKKDDERKVARAAAPKKDEDKKVQRSPATPGVPAVTPHVEQGIERTRGGGQPLPQAERDRLEPALGADLSGVRVHTDSHAAGLADDLEAKAFTTGQDVYFAEGQYQPHTPEGRHLLAHELTHTVQQGGTVDRVQRAPKRPKMPTVASGAPDLDITQDHPWLGGKKIAKNELELDSVDIPKVKLQPPGNQWDPGKGPFKKIRHFQRLPNDQQVPDWRNKVGLDNEKVRQTWRDAFQERLNLKNKTGDDVPVQDKVFYKAEDKAGNSFFGKPKQLAAHLSIPTWTQSGSAAKDAYQVDHIRELQLANYENPAKHWANDPENLWLLDGPTNGSSGAAILGAIKSALAGFRDRMHAYYQERAKADGHKNHKAVADADLEKALKKADKALLNANDAYDQYAVNFKAVDPVLDPDPVGKNLFWTKAQIEKAEHLKHIKVPETGVKVGHIVIFGTGFTATPLPANPPSPTPPPAVAVPTVGMEIPTAKKATLTDRQRLKFLPPMSIEGRDLKQTPDSGSHGTLTMGLPKSRPIEFPSGTVTTLEVSAIPGVQDGAQIDSAAALKLLNKARYKHASPIEIREVSIDPGVGVQARGVIRAEAPLLREGIDFQILGDELRVYKAFGFGAFEVPRPITVDGSSLTISASTKTGLEVAGQIDFSIEKVGSGFLAASAGTQKGFALAGGFDFDSKLFDPARIKMAYRDNKWSGEGEIGIPKGRLKGVEQASVKVSYEEGKLEATGTADLSVPGVQKAGLGIVYSEAEGLTISGDITLRDDIPGIKSGSGKAQIRQLPDGAWEVAASGEAEPAIPGISARIKFDYAAGALTVEGSASYARGMLAGSLTVGATNRPIGEDGKPAPGEPSEKLTAYGGGQMTVTLTPWLQGTVGVRLLPNGEIELSGAIGLPAALDLFPAKTYEKNLFKIGLDIPIIGVAVAGQRIGIFATVGGGLDLSAGVGPGQLRELGLEITYNPAHEDQTHITGRAQLHVPAHAGLRLFVRAGIGAGIPIVSASLNLEIGAQLGLEAALNAGVQVDWTPTTGLVLDAAAEVYAEPKFKFDITGVALVEADLLLTTIELYEKRWKLAEFEYGSGLRLGLKVPIHYEEGKPFDVTWDQVQFQTPDIDPMELLSGLVEEIA